MKICRQLLSLILLFSCACATLGVDGSSGPAAVLYARGKVQVNGADSRKITTSFSGDSIQTDADSVANIIARGFTQGGNGDRHLGGDVRDGVWSNHYATAEKLSKFEVAEDDDSVTVAARQGNVAVSDGQQTSTIPEGQQTTRKKKKRAGAAPAANGSHAISGKTVAIVAGAAGAIAATGIVIANSGGHQAVPRPGSPGCSSVRIGAGSRQTPKRSENCDTAGAL